MGVSTGLHAVLAAASPTSATFSVEKGVIMCHMRTLSVLADKTIITDGDI